MTHFLDFSSQITHYRPKWPICGFFDLIISYFAINRLPTCNLKKHLDKFHHDFIEEYDDLCDEHLNAPIPIQPQESINFVRLAHTDPLVGNPLKYGFHSFLQESRYCDTVLHCSDGKISLHRLVLASASPFLRKCLRVDWKNCDYDADLIFL